MTLPAFVGAIGSDRYLTREELVVATGDHPAIGDAWGVYQNAFGGYCETGVDPLWSRLTNPIRDTGALRCAPGESVVVVGTGPSALAGLPVLREIRARVHLFTSPRGAEWLAGHGVTPDLVLVEHQTALDAHHAVRHLSDIGRNPIAGAPLVAADWRTPGALLAGVAQERVFVPEAMPTWGLWPATAVALAAQAGAARVGLLGIDLGTAAAADPAYAPLSALLGLLSRACNTTMLDCGGGARKPGWAAAAVGDCAADHPRANLVVGRSPAPSCARRYADAVQAGRRLSPQIARARQILRLALAARAGHPAPGLVDAASELLSWGDDPQRRVDLQESMGLTFLPRLWRTRIDSALGAAIWRPVMLATHELVGQADRFDALVRREAA